MSGFFSNAISPHEEMVAYETLWAMPDESQKSIAEQYKANPGLPSQLLRQRQDLLSDELTSEVYKYLQSLSGFSISVHGAFQYPAKLRHAQYPLELIYYRGDLGYTESRCISVVGTRKCSSDGAKRTKRLVSELVESGFTIVSGLAAGVDTVAMTTAIEQGGSTIGVIGTPINQSYPRENRDLQEHVAKCFCLISQVPFYRYEHEPFWTRRRYFPARNETMAALSEATVIVEASETSGTLTQARACLRQSRKLFILNSCFEIPGLKWPHEFEKRGAIRVRGLEDILSALPRMTNAVVEED